MTEDEERGVVIDGTTVRRPAQPWSSTIHSLLEYLRSAGVTCVPEPLSLQGGVEVLRFIPGASGAECWALQATEDGLRSAARLLREVHDATRGWTPPDGAEWGIPADGVGEVICHGDPGPWNMVWNGGRAVALIDWDFAYPGDAIEDVAYALEYLAPFRSDQDAQRWHGFSSAPDRRGRVETFVDAYGLGDWPTLVDEVIARQQASITHVQELADRGIQPQTQWVRDGYLDTLIDRVTWSNTHRELFG